MNWDELEQKLINATTRCILLEDAIKYSDFMGYLNKTKETLESQALSIPNKERDEKGYIPEEFRGQKIMGVLNFLMIHMNIEGGSFPMTDDYKTQVRVFFGILRPQEK